MNHQQPQGGNQQPPYPHPGQENTGGQPYGGQPYGGQPYGERPVNKDKALPFLLFLLFLNGFGVHWFFIGRKDKGMEYIYLLIALVVLYVLGFFTCGITLFLTFIPAVWVTVLFIRDIVYLIQGKVIDGDGYIVKF